MATETTPQPQKGRPSSATAAAAAKGAGSFLLPETGSQGEGKTREFPVGAPPSPRRDLVKRDLTRMALYPARLEGVDEHRGALAGTSAYS